MEFLRPTWKDCKFSFLLTKYAAHVLKYKYPAWDLLKKKDMNTAAYKDGTCIVSNGKRGRRTPVPLQC